MANLVCVNPECTQHDVAKANLADFPAAEARCGRCGLPVEETTAEPPPELPSAEEAPVETP